MGFHCAAYACNTGYATNRNTDADGVTFHSFLDDSVSRHQWIRANPRKDFIPTKFSRLCSLHFRGCSSSVTFDSYLENCLDRSDETQ